MRSFFIWILGVLVATTAHAQDPVFSMFYLNKQVLNPAYSGINRDLQVTALSRLQWSGLPGKMRTSTVSADIACPSSRLGFGMVFHNDVAGDAFLTRNQAVFNLAVHIPGRYPRNSSIKAMRGRKYIFSAALGYGVGQKRVDWNNLVFSDQLDQVLGIIRPSNAPIGAQEVTNIVHDLNAGLLFRSEINRRGSYVSIGASGFHLNSPVESFFGSDYTIPMRFNIHSFLNLRISQKYSNNLPIYLTLGGTYDRQQTLSTTQIGGTFTFGKNFLLGAWFRNQYFSFPNANTDAFVLNLVYSTSVMSIGYSFDLTVSQLGVAQTQGTHEIGLNFRLQDIYLCKKKSRRGRADRQCFLVDEKFFNGNDVINFLP
jgi:type IX secretion system PorP/SprF family membrane protein